MVSQVDIPVLLYGGNSKFLALLRELSQRVASEEFCEILIFPKIGIEQSFKMMYDMTRFSV